MSLHRIISILVSERLYCVHLEFCKTDEEQTFYHHNTLPECVVMARYRDHYKWNKVTTCIHNLLGGQRWVDQYGEMTITNGNIVCKLTFTKVSVANTTIFLELCMLFENRLKHVFFSFSLLIDYFIISVFLCLQF